VTARKDRLPPLLATETFADTYEMVLVLDNREQFSRSNAGMVADRNRTAQQLGVRPAPPPRLCLIRPRASLFQTRV
jgi:hypothetical protein